MFSARNAFMAGVAKLVDLFWSSVTSSIKTIGVSGATNNAFRDDGPYTLLPVRVGDTTQGALSPYGPTVGTAPPQIGGSVYIPATTGSYLSLPANNSAFSFGTGDFTIEGWFWRNDTASLRTLFNIGYYSSGQCVVFRSDYFRIGSYTTNLNSYLPANQWLHVAVTRQGTTFRVFVNGAIVASGSDSTNISATDGGETMVTIGTSIHAPNTEYLNGSVSNFRVVKGTALYTAAFTPPTVPLTAVSGTTVLTCQSSTAITDASTNNFTVTRNGDARSVVDTPFGYGSAYFDGGSSTYLSVSDNAALRLGSGNFTVEMWWYPTVSGGYQTLVDKGYTQTGAFLIQTVGTAIGVYLGGTSAISAGAVAANTWNHIAVVRSGTTVTLYINGLSVGTATSSANLTDGAPLNIGASSSPYGNGNYPSTGYISNVRVVKGTAVYSGTTFTPPTTALTAVSNTVLLTAQDKAVVADASSNAFTVTKSGTAKPTDWTPFAVRGSGQWSAYFDGSGDYLTATLPDSLGTADFTIESWLNPSTFSFSTYWNIWWLFSSYSGFKVHIKPDGYLTCRINDAVIVDSTTPLTLNTWNHVALVRSSGYFTWYINGVAAGSSPNAVNLSSTTSLYIGTMAGSGGYFTGYMSNLRFVKGSALYTAAFTPPTSALAAVPGTSLLALQENRFKDNGPNNLTITRTGDVAISRYNPFGSAVVPTTNFSTGSITTDNAASSYFTVGASSDWVFPGDYTIEAWVMPRTTNVMVVWATGGLGSSDQFTIGPSSTNTATDGYCFWSYGLDGGQIASNITMPIKRWSHVAVCRVGSTLRMFVNGIVVATKTGATSTIGRNDTGYIGARSNFEYPLFGNISNLRIVKGTGLYTTNFTPSTSPLTAVSGTVLLTCQGSNTITDASPNNYTITSVGTTYITEASPFKRVTYPSGGSAYFDGSGDYINIPSSPGLLLGTADFTVEFWVNPQVPSTSAQQIFFVSYGGSERNGVAIGMRSGHMWWLIGNGSTWVFERNAGSELPVNAWSHVAVTRSNGTARLFVNGVQIDSVADSTNITQGTGWTVGAYYSYGYNLTGHMANVRVVKGVAVYTTNFIPPTTPVTAIGGTSLLLNFDNAAIYDSTGDRNIVINGTTTQTSAAVTKFGTERTMYFSGAGSSCVSIPDSVDLRFGTGDFTIECWFYPINTQYAAALWYRGSGTTGTTQAIVLNVSGLNVQYNGGSVISSSGSGTGAHNVNAWNHVAVSRTSSSTKLFLNGIQVGSTMSDSTDYNLAERLTIGDRYPNHPYSNYPFTGYISDFRVTKGVGRYTSNFSVPTASFPTSNT